MGTPSNIGRLVREIRKATLLTQEQLARRMGVHVFTVIRWERGSMTPRTHRRMALELLHRAHVPRLQRPQRRRRRH